jgi:HEAT repeat protein
VPGLAPDLLAALDDPEPRVREAAAGAFAADVGCASGPPGLVAALAKRLAGDDWTFVRLAAARTLGAEVADPAADEALAAALQDGSPDVRGMALDGLGTHRATAHADAIRARQDDGDEDMEVRARAMVALGLMCDTRSLGAWTKLAAGAKAPLDDKAKRLGGAAIAALGAVHPKDLGERLAPLLAEDTPALVREMAKAAMETQPACR